MSIRLRELIRAIRACKTAAEERAVIAKECANIRTAFKDEESIMRHRNVAKLLFIQMLGYPTHFGQMECLKLIASNKFPEKRIGYVGLMLLLDEATEVLMLVTNSLKNDLNHPTQYVVGLALCALGNIASEDMARDLAPEVEKLLGSSNPYIRKKAALCAIRIFRKNNDLMENFADRIKALINDRNHGVLVAGVTAIAEMLAIDPSYASQFKKLVTILVRILKSLVLSGYAPEHDIYGITDPFLQVKILRVLRQIAQQIPATAEAMNDILAQVATNTETGKTAGNAILYECVLTIMGIESESGLRVLAINILGRFLMNRDNNIRYIALKTLNQVVATDIQAVQRHRNTIVECLKDPDISIRRRALDLAYALINENNIRLLARELLNFLIVSDVEFKQDLTTKICAVVEKYAPNKRWQCDTVIQVLQYGGNFVRDEIPANLIALVASEPELHGYAVHRLLRAMQQDDGKTQALVQVTAWCIGEFGENLLRPAADGDAANFDPLTDEEVVGAVSLALRHPLTNVQSREYLLTALIKLSTRLPSAIVSIKKLLSRYRNSIDLELQQRACEYTNLFAVDTIRPGLLEPMPVPAPTRDGEEGEDSEGVPVAAAPVAAAPAAAPAGEVDLLGLDAMGLGGDPTPAAPVAQTGGGLDDLLSMGAGAPAAPAAQAAPAQNLNNADMLMDLLGSGPAAQPAPQAQPMGGMGGMGGVDALMGGGAPMGGAAPPAAQPIDLLSVGGLMGGGPVGTPGAFQAYNKNGLQIEMTLSKAGNPPNVTTLNTSFTNNTANPMTNFQFLAAVPKYLKVQLQPASSSEVPANSASKITQVIKVADSTNGAKPIMMRVKIEYDAGGVHHSDQDQIGNFPTV